MTHRVKDPSQPTADPVSRVAILLAQLLAQRAVARGADVSKPLEKESADGTQTERH